MKNILFSLFLTAAALIASGAEKPVPIPGAQGWNLRCTDKKEIRIQGNTLCFDVIGKKSVMAAAKEPVKLICHFGKIRVKGKFKGKGTFQIGFHSYTAQKYYATRTSRNLLLSSPDQFVDVEHVQLFGDFDLERTPLSLHPDRGFFCIYAFPGSKGVFKDLKFEITQGEVDKTSPISLEKPSAKEYPLQRRLLLPPVIYGVEGVETNLYYDNVFLVPDVKNYTFSFEYNTPGMNFADRWSFIPKKKDAGKTRSITLTVRGLNGETVAKKSFLLQVAPAQAGKGKKYSLLMIGDSITDYVKAYPTQVCDRFRKSGTAALTMIGTKLPYKGKDEAVKHEGYSGWAYATFLQKGPFVKMVNGFPVLDFEGYFKQNNAGKAPDFVTIQLGVNDIFGARDYTVRTAVSGILSDMDQMIKALRKAAPQAVIGIGLPTPGASQDAFGKVYGCRQTRYQYKRNIFALSHAVIRRYHNSADKKIFIVPIHVNLDTVNNFPAAMTPVNQGNTVQLSCQTDGLHPAPAGGRQLGDALYGFLKYQMSLKK